MPERKRIPLALLENDNPTRLGSGIEVGDLVSSLAIRGQLSPIRVRPHPAKQDRYQVIFGSRRLAAAKELGWDAIDAEVTSASDIDALVLAFSENSDRKDFSDFEKATIIQRLHDLTLKSYAEIADVLGKSSAFVSQHVAMLKLFPETIATKEERFKVLSALMEAHARVLMRIEDQNERWSTAKWVVASGMSARELMKLYIRRTEHVIGQRRLRRTGEVKEIRELIEEMISGMNLKDVRLCAKRFTDNFTLLDDFPPYGKMDIEEAKNHFLSVLRTVDNYNQTIEDVQLKIREKFAYAIVICSYELSSGGRKLKIKSRGTLVFEKEGITWKIAHQHWSSLDPVVFLNFLFRRRTEIPSFSDATMKA